jgi:hypothetical protein
MVLGKLVCISIETALFTTIVGVEGATLLPNITMIIIQTSGHSIFRCKEKREGPQMKMVAFYKATQPPITTPMSPLPHPHVHILVLKYTNLHVP